jgi:hypothetical protein
MSLISGVETLRTSYRPDPVRVLFVGESAPAGGTFFYSGDSNLFQQTRQGFEAAYQCIWPSATEFLAAFKQLGCYLDDLCIEPVNHLDDRQRYQRRIDSVPSLGERLATYAPTALVIVMKKIEPYVNEAMEQVGIDIPHQYVLPFPNWPRDRQRYVTKLIEAIHDLRQHGVMVE